MQHALLFLLIVAAMCVLIIGWGAVVGVYRGLREGRAQRRIARTHSWRSEYRPTSTEVPGSQGTHYAQHLYVCERCGHMSGTSATCDEALSAAASPRKDNS